MNELVTTARYAYDLEILRDAYSLRALIFIYFDDYASAVEDFKKMRAVAVQEDNLEAKMDAYENIGKCY